jgi:dienelactone hydrolase
MRSLMPCVVFSCLLVSLLVGSASAEPTGPADPGLSGPFEVGFTFLLLNDPGRAGRPIPVYLWYPVDPDEVDAGTQEAFYPLDPVFGFVPPSASSFWETYGFERAYAAPPPSAQAPFPLVVFSPGWGAGAWWHIHLGARLASHGFAVAVLYHYGDAALLSWEPRDHLAVAAMNRPLDISFVLTDLLDRSAAPGGLLQGLVDPARLVAAGWSLGGYAAMTLAGGDDLVCDRALNPEQGPPPAETCVASAPDPRIGAIVTLDGSAQLLSFEELSRIGVPTLGMGEEWSTLEALLGPEMASWQARLHAANQGRPSYRVDLADAHHTSFSNSCEAVHVLFDMGLLDQGGRDYFASIYCSPPIPTSVAYRHIGRYAIAFLKTNVAGVPEYQSVLTPGDAQGEPYVEFFVTEKRGGQPVDEDWPGDFLYFAHQPGSEQARAARDPAESLPIQYVGPE